MEVALSDVSPDTADVRPIKSLSSQALKQQGRRDTNVHCSNVNFKQIAGAQLPAVKADSQHTYSPTPPYESWEGYVEVLTTSFSW